MWWTGRPRRMVQTNLREIDADLDADALVASLRDFQADTLLFNVGGIVANYPSDLPFHFVNPNLRGRDLVGDMTARCRDAGIRFIARFDFSKVNQTIATEHPDWLYVSETGQTVSYNGQVHTCINGPYQQQCSHEILREVLDRYPIDGVFFNMIGYVTTDYSGNHHGYCRCANCSDRFQAFSGSDIPRKHDPDDPVSRQYELFKRQTSRELFHAIRDSVKRRRADVAICTYTHEGVDIVRCESNSGIARHQPEWTYRSTHNVKRVLGSWPEKAVANATVHFVDFPYRHAAVAPMLSAVRTAQDLVHHGWLDFYVIGHLNNQEDRAGLRAVQRIFDYHARHEAIFGDLRSTARIALIEPSASAMVGGGGDFRGMLRLLAEEHLLYDVLHDSVLDSDEAPGRSEGYDLLILPDARVLSERAIDAIQAHIDRGGALLCTGLPGLFDEQGRDASIRRCGFLGIAHATPIARRAGSYFRIHSEDRSVLRGLDDLDLVFQDQATLDCTPAEGTQTHLRYIPGHMFGPPEKCYYVQETDIPGLLVNRLGRGVCALLPWTVAEQYGRFPAHGHRLLLRAVLRDVLAAPRPVEVDATSLLEINLLADRAGRFDVLHLVNLAEQWTSQVDPALPVRDVAVRVAGDRPVESVRLLAADVDLPFEAGPGGATFTVPRVDLIESAVIHYT